MQITASIYDLAPTILKLYNAKIPEGIDGKIKSQLKSKTLILQLLSNKDEH